MEKKKWRLKNIHPADPHTRIFHILMSHEQLPSCSIPNFAGFKDFDNCENFFMKKN